MGLLGDLKGLAGGSATRTQPIILAGAEEEIARTTACTLKFGGKPWVGGELVLTTSRLLFTPLNVKDLAAVLGYGLQKAGLPGAIAAVGWLEKQARPEAAELAAIVSVLPHPRRPGLFHPPAIVVQLTDGRAIEFGVLAEGLRLNCDGVHVRARDQFVRAVGRALG